MAVIAAAIAVFTARRYNHKNDDYFWEAKLKSICEIAGTQLFFFSAEELGLTSL
jgi:hypothetical protein